MKRITIRDVAREAGVSVTLVSFVMNAKVGEDGKLQCPVNAETAARVQKVAKELGYRRNAAAASLRSGRSNSIAVITTDIANKFFAGISRFIEDKAASYGYTVFFGSSDENVRKLESILDTLFAHNIDGVIVAPVEGCESAIKRLQEARIPVVLLDRDLKSIENVSKVLLDDKEAGRISTQLLLDNGYRRIEMISYSLGISSLKEREDGYVSCMREAGYAENIKIHHTTYASVAEDVRGIIRTALDNGTEAFFLPTYSLSAQVMLEMKEMNLSTPDDFAIVGFDKSNIYKLFSTSVAHIQQPLKELGEKSVELLCRQIESEGQIETIVLKPTLVPGGSAIKQKI